MMTSRVLLALGMLWSMAASLSVYRQSDHSKELQESCRSFVQDFYDWYVPKSLETRPQPLQLALKHKRSAFSAELVREIEISEAKDRSEGEAWLDFDPVLNSQDPADRYVVRTIRLQGKHYWAEIHPVVSGKESEKPAVVAELKFSNGRWFFMDFHYPNSNNPDSESLLRILRRLRTHDSM